MLGKSLIYFGSNIANALIPLALLPILTRVLSVGEYGQVGLFQTLVTALAGVVGLSAAGAAGRRYFDEMDSPEEMATYVGSALQVLLASMVPIVAVTLVFSPLISSQLQIPTWWVVAAAVVPGCNVVIQMRLVQWQVRGAAAAYGMLQVGYSVVNFALSLLLVLAMHQGGTGEWWRRSSLACWSRWRRSCCCDASGWCASWSGGRTRSGSCFTSDCRWCRTPWACSCWCTRTG